MANRVLANTGGHPAIVRDRLGVFCETRLVDDTDDVSKTPRNIDKHGLEPISDHQVPPGAKI